MHAAAYRALALPHTYEAIRATAGDLPRLVGELRSGAYDGFNVTVPHKQAVARLVSRCDAAAHAIGAVNTLWFEGDDLVGGNTDAQGFIDNLDGLAPGWDRPGATAVILGAGGAARAAVHGLLGRGFEIALVNRTRATADALAAYFGDAVSAHDAASLPSLLPRADLLVNTTSLGMVGKAPLEIDLAPLKPSAVVHDVVYVPLETRLLADAKRRGHRTVDGLGMLLHQAVAGFARWFGATPQVTPELRALVEADIRAKTPGA